MRCSFQVPRFTSLVSVSWCVLLMLLSGMGRLPESDIYLLGVRTTADFERISISTRFPPGADRVTRFLAPGRADSELLPTLFVNVNRFAFTFDFLVSGFPDRFPGLTPADYLALVERRATRSYFEGVLWRFRQEPVPLYGFDLFTAPGSQEELLRVEEVRWVYDQLRQVFLPGTLVYSPQPPEAARIAAGWVDPGFPVLLAEGMEEGFIPYTMGSGCGRVRVLSEAEFIEANQTGSLSQREILVLEKAPAEIDGAVAGLITGEAQSELSDATVRMAARGAVNARVKDALQAFALYRDRLARLSIDAMRYTVEEITPDEAQACWEAHRLSSSAFQTKADPAYDRLDAASEVPIDGPVDLVSRYGGKGTNFARLHQLLPAEHREKGLLVPFAHSLRFLQSNLARSPVDPAREVTLERYIQELLADPGFRSDPRRRSEELGKLRQAIERGTVDPETARSVALRIVEVLGAGSRMVRLHASSIAEDVLDSGDLDLRSWADACAADDLDADEIGPSRCDPNQSAERTVAQALKRVWASLWTFKAYEEREHFQIDHLNAAMAVLVTETFAARSATGVAISGNPLVRGDERFTVIAQRVDRDPGADGLADVPEKDLLTVSNAGVAGIVRARPSSLVKPGELVLSEEQLGEIGKVASLVQPRFHSQPWDYPERIRVQFQLQVDPAGSLRFKQARALLIPRGPDELASFRLRVPPGMTLCGSFFEGRTARQVLETKAQLALRPGLTLLRADGSSRTDLFEWIQLGPDGPRLAPTGPGHWQVRDWFGFDGPYYAFNMSQDFPLQGGTTLSVSVRNLMIPLNGREVTFDPPALTWATNPYYLQVQAGIGPEGWEELRHFLPCNLEHLPLWTVDLRLKNGDRFHFQERFQPALDGTGPAELVLAELTLGGRLYRVEDYWRLVYTAGYENKLPRPDLMAILDRSVEVAGVGQVRAVLSREGYRGGQHQAFYLGESLEPLAAAAIERFGRQQEGVPLLPAFRRGDVDASQRLNLTDAIRILLYLFAGAGLDCLDAADVDDRGTVEITDAILLLGYLFLGQAAPAGPDPWFCGEDVNPDSLPDCPPDICWY